MAFAPQPLWSGVGWENQIKTIFIREIENQHILIHGKSFLHNNYQLSNTFWED